MPPARTFVQTATMSCLPLWNCFLCVSALSYFGLFPAQMTVTPLALCINLVCTVWWNSWSRLCSGWCNLSRPCEVWAFTQLGVTGAAAPVPRDSGSVTEDAVTVAAAAAGAAVCWCPLSLSPGSWPVTGTSSRSGCRRGEHGAWGHITLQEVEKPAVCRGRHHVVSQGDLRGIQPWEEPTGPLFGVFSENGVLTHAEFLCAQACNLDSAVSRGPGVSFCSCSPACAALCCPVCFSSNRPNPASFFFFLSSADFPHSCLCLEFSQLTPSSP